MTLSVSDIGKTIRRRRCELRLTQEELAEQIGVTCQQLQRYEYGENTLNVAALQTIAQVLQVPVAWFFNERDSESEAWSAPVMTPAEQQLVEQFRRIGSGEMRSLVLNILKTATTEELQG
jgi:transcriptional regulator with XRE-family HTH domain